LSQYYLRARYYDPSNGRFNRLDPFAGNNFEPQSLHKYAYAHADPVNGIDPSGRLTLVEKVSTLAIITVVANILLTAYVTGKAYQDINYGDGIDGFIVSFRISAQRQGFVGAAGFDLIQDKSQQWWLAVTGEGGTSPISYFNSFGGLKPYWSWSVTFGVLFDMEDATQLSGLGSYAVWPASAVHLLHFKENQYGAFAAVRQLAKNIRRRQSGIFEVGLSFSGPVYMAAGWWNNTFSAGFTISTKPIPVSTLSATIGSYVQPFLTSFGNAPNDFTADPESYADKLLNAQQSVDTSTGADLEIFQNNPVDGF
jgi:hypothetical protein